jgi:hypothetical protein
MNSANKTKQESCRARSGAPHKAAAFADLLHDTSDVKMYDLQFLSNFPGDIPDSKDRISGYPGEVSDFV